MALIYVITVHSQQTLVTRPILQTAGVRVRLRSRWVCWNILLHQRGLTYVCACANTWPVYGCGFTYLGYAQKL